MPVRATVALESEGKRERVWWCEEVTRNPGGRGSVNESGGEKKRLGIPGGESAWPPTPSARQDDCLESQPASCMFAGPPTAPRHNIPPTCSLIYLPTPTHIRASRRRGRSTASPRGDWRAPAMRAASCREIASHRIPSHRIASHRTASHRAQHAAAETSLLAGADARACSRSRGCVQAGEAIPTWAASSPLAAARLGILEETQAPSPHTTRQRDTTARLPTTSYDVGTAPDRPPAHEQGGTDDGGEGGQRAMVVGFRSLARGGGGSQGVLNPHAKRACSVIDAPATEITTTSRSHRTVHKPNKNSLDARTPPPAGRDRGRGQRRRPGVPGDTESPGASVVAGVRPRRVWDGDDGGDATTTATGRASASTARPHPRLQPQPLSRVQSLPASARGTRERSRNRPPRVCVEIEMGMGIETTLCRHDMPTTLDGPALHAYLCFCPWQIGGLAERGLVLLPPPERAEAEATETWLERGIGRPVGRRRGDECVMTASRAQAVRSSRLFFPFPSSSSSFFLFVRQTSKTKLTLHLTGTAPGTSPRLSSTDLLPLPEAQRIRTGSSRSYRRTSDETMDILSWTFARSPEGEDEHKPVSPSSARKPLGSKATTREESEERLTGLPQLYIDAANPHRSLSYARTRSQVRRLIAGFARHGVQKGDCVCVVSLNDVRIRAAATLSERRLTRLTLTRARSTTPLCTSPSSAPALALRVLTRGYVDRTARVPFLSSSASPAVLRISPESARDLATRGRRRPGDIDSSDLPSPRCTQEDRLIPRQYTPRELAHHLRITGATHVLTSLKALPAAQAAAAECQIPPPRVFLLNFRHEAVAPGLQSWTALLAHGERAWRAGEEVAAGDLEAAAYVSTSGTSGLPKAAVIGHGYLISQAQVVEGLVGAGERPKVRSFPPPARLPNSTAADCRQISSLIAIPPFHVFTMPVQHALPLRTGTPAYIMPRFEDERFAGALREFEISHAIVVPPILMALSRRAATELASLQTVFVGGSCATAGMQRQLYAKLAPAARIVQVYGMTETGWAACWARAARDGTGSVGQPVAGTRLRLADPAGRGITSDGQTGEIQINTLHAMTGYLGDPAATAAARTPDGWTRTGDVGYVRRGDWYIIDRTKDLIKVRGWQVSPAEIEAALLEHPGVRDAGVVAAAAADGWGEVPWAFVVRSGAGAVDELGVRAFLGARLARYKNVGGVEFVAEIPRNPTGKILRRVLRDAQSQLQGERPGSGGGQAAAIEYASALKDLYAYQVSRASTGVTLVGGKAVPTAEKVQSAGTLVPERGGKRKPYAATSFLRWRKLRGLARSSSRAVAPNKS
ncbi:AMP-binding enzyme [Diplocarpon mali]|nr:AMP-binding enzyme [Diplocarpon mali]